MTDATTDGFSLVHGAHRLIRAIDEREGPFAGRLVACGEGVAVSVPAETLGDWPGWAYADAEHVGGVVDIARRVDGHDVLLPWCTARVESFLGRRQLADAPLVAGEIGTLTASVVRGLRELSDGEEAAGDWWLTGDGRPVFMHGDGGAPRARTAELVERVAQHTSDRAMVRVMEEVVAALRQARHHRDDERRWEEQLFAIAAPRALRLDVFAPERVSETAARRLGGAPGLGDARAARRPATHPPFTHHVRERLAAVVELVREVISRRHRTRDEMTRTADGETKRVLPRRRAFLVAAGLGVAVLAVGMLWPSGSADNEAQAAPQPSVTQTQPAEVAPSPAAEHQTSDDLSSPLSGDVLATVPALLGRLQECAGGTGDGCAELVTAHTQVPEDGLVTQGAASSEASLIEDYGDVVVVKLTPVASDAVAQMLVLERDKKLWLLRDVYDVAQQPE
ncbi:hypothetical protein [Microbacterium sp.]|uniref:hypothetical protein n=1 Tax=Microbacterium sp. TaxID=51671 RepID=UPI00260C0137|nr:hypothetical protein [Microbacterium sp.]